ncbi:hypothetical protein C0Q70_02698 [Pomacea canaliculata]|uniref:Uncharacterized protein n=1 Tax=Pomacea canaliculata TaxID=400727 RepID=A0A2T7PQP7_POMCA|nr:hypothetical protein C0Q70_02698 [Pomacea canaliculata]
MILRNDNSSKSPRKLLEYLPRQRQVGECQRLRTRDVSTQDDLAEEEEEEDRESSLHLSTDNRWMVFGSRLDSSSGGSLQWPRRCSVWVSEKNMEIKAGHPPHPQPVFLSVWMRVPVQRILKSGKKETDEWLQEMLIVCMNRLFGEVLVFHFYKKLQAH